MKPLYISSKDLDLAAVNKGLTELVLQENAAVALARKIRKNVPKNSRILAICGSGNNAADAIAALRMLQGSYKCEVMLTKENLNQNAQTQLNIAINYGVTTTTKFYESKNYAAFVDGVFGSGLKGEVPPEIALLFDRINRLDTFKLSVDTPSGIDEEGRVRGAAFCADATVSMGVLKLGLFSDMAKDFVGKVSVANLGVESALFGEGDKFKVDKFGEKHGKQKCDFLLESEDLIRPKRNFKNCHKGDFGHAFVVCGEMDGAANLASLSALRVGAGRVSMVFCDEFDSTAVQSQKEKSKELAVREKTANVVKSTGGFGDSAKNFEFSTDKNANFIDINDSSVSEVKFENGFDESFGGGFNSGGFGAGFSSGFGGGVGFVEIDRGVAGVEISSERGDGLNGARGRKEGASSVDSEKDAAKSGGEGGKKSGVVREPKSISVMKKRSFEGATAVSVGSGLGSAEFDLASVANLPCVLDADVFYKKEILAFLDKKDTILTPHPKEFAALLGVSTREVVENRFSLARKFSREHKAVLVLKGANPLIAYAGVLYVAHTGTPVLAKGGSGDVLTGIIVGLLAQGYSPLEAALNGVLMHIEAARAFKGNDFSMTPEDLVECLRFV